MRKLSVPTLSKLWYNRGAENHTIIYGGANENLREGQYGR